MCHTKKSSPFFCLLILTRLMGSLMAETVPLEGDWRFSPNDDPRFARADCDDKAWLSVQAPKPLRGQNPEIRSGNGWYRRQFRLGAPFGGQDLVFSPGAIHGAYSVYFNGQLVGTKPARSGRTRFLVPAAIAHAPGDNVLAIRVRSRDGIQSGKVQLSPADEKTRQNILSEYVRSTVRFDVQVPPLAAPRARSIAVKVSIENPGAFNPLIDSAPGQVILRHPEGEPVASRDLRLSPGKAQDFEFTIPAAEHAWEVALAVRGAAVVTRRLAALDYLEPLTGIRVDPHSHSCHDSEGRMVALFAGQAPERQRAPLKRERPIIVNLTSAILWDDYYLPHRRAGHFVEQFARTVRGGAETVDASFQGLPLLLLPEVHKIITSAGADIVVVSIGEHEHYFSPSLEDFSRALDAVVRCIRGCTTAHIVLVTPPPALKSREISRPFAEAMGRVARDHGLPVVDTAQVFDAESGDLEALYDRLCPNGKAHDLIARALQKLLPREEITRILRRDEFVHDVPASKGKTITLMDGQMPSPTTITKNTKWEDARGRAAHWHEGTKGQSEHRFMDGDPILVRAGSSLVQEVIFDREPRPKSIMLAFGSSQLSRPAQGLCHFSGQSYNHGVFWGDDLISYGRGKTGQPAHVDGGAMPEAGDWASLSIDPKAVGLVGRYLNSIRFVTHGGTVRWGRTLLRTAKGERAWVNGRFPVTSGRGRTWQWVPAPGREGKRAHRPIDISGERSYSFQFPVPIPVQPGARLRQWVYIPPGREPSRIALVPNARGPHTYWGRLKAYDRPGQRWLYGGPMPRPGQWAALEVALTTRLTGIGFLTRTGSALWGAMEIVGVAPKFDLPEDFHFDHGTSQSAARAVVGSTIMGNQFFEAQTPKLLVTLVNPEPSAWDSTVTLEITDAWKQVALSRHLSCKVPPAGMATTEVICEGFSRGYYHVRAVDADGAELASTSMSVLPSNVNLLEKDVFVYNNTGPIAEQYRFFDLLGGKWCQVGQLEQEMFRIEGFGTAPAGGRSGGIDEVVEAYHRARNAAAREKSSPHRTQYWFNISSDEENLKWHNLERWSEVIRAVTIGLKQSDPNCVVSTPEINSIAMGFLDKLGENHTFDYLDLYFTYGCSLPVPPECTNKYWSFDIDALAEIEERFGRRLTATGMQYSTGNIGRAWGIHDEHQAAYYVRGDILRRTRDVDYIAYFKFREGPNVNVYEVKDAINHVDLTPKPAFVALVNNFAILNRSSYRGHLVLGPGIHAYLFDRPSGPVLALWTTEPVPQTVNLNLLAPAVAVTDLYGKRQRVETASGFLAFKVTGDVRYIEGIGRAITRETSFRPAPLLDDREFAAREIKEAFVAIDTIRRDSLNFGDDHYVRGDLAATAGATLSLPVNVYNFSTERAAMDVRLALPGGFHDRTGDQTCDLAPGSGTTLRFTVSVPLDRAPGLEKIRATAWANGKELDPFTTDILILSPLDIRPLEAAPVAGTPIRVRFTNAARAPVDAEVRLELPFRWRTREPTKLLENVPGGGAAEAEFVLAAAEPKPFHRYRAAAFAKVGQNEAAYHTELDFTVVQPTDHPIVLDGRLDEWFTSTPLDCGQRGNNYIYNTLSQILDPQNFSLRFRAMYDRENLYLSFDVWDDQICEEDTKHDLLWDLDAVQIKFDTDGDGKGDERLNVSCTGRSYMVPDDPRGDREPMITGSKGLAKLGSRVFHDPTPSHPRGSIMELAVPWSYFQAEPLVPKPGTRLGVHIFCVDEDVRAWSARPWKFDNGRKNVVVPFTLGSAVEGAIAKDWTPRGRPARRVFSRAPGDIAAAKVREAGLVTGPYTAGNAERFPTTGLELPDRARAQRLWFFGPGYIEYEYDLGEGTVPGKVRSVEFAAELATCYRPGNTHYALPGNPTRLHIRIGNIDIGSCDLLGDPGVDGWLVRMQVTESGTLYQGKRISQVKLGDLLAQLKGKVRVRLSAEGIAGSPGGLNVHGPNGSGVHGIAPSLIIVYVPDRAARK